MKANPLISAGSLAAICLTVVSFLPSNLRAEAAASTKDNAARREKIKEHILQKFDANNNGTLDPNEKEALRKAIQEHRASGKGGARKLPGAGGLKDAAQKHQEAPSSSAITA